LRPGDRPHLFCKLHVCRRRKGEAKAFTWSGYRGLIIAAHRELAAPVVWIRGGGLAPGAGPSLSN